MTQRDAGKSDKRICFRVTPDQMQALDAECWRRHVTITELMHDVLGEHFSTGHGGEEAALYWRPRREDGRTHRKDRHNDHAN